MRALVFPGQGAQYVGMAMELAERHPIARDILGQADDILGMALSDIIANGPESELTRTDISQPAILTASWMAYSVLARHLEPLLFSATAGLSLGEYTAHCAAGSLSFADALTLVRIRGQAMQQAADAVPSGMVALIGGDEQQAAELCEACAEGDVLTVANLNSPGQVVIAGAEGACQRAVAAAKEHGFRRALPLPVAGAFHSPLMQPAAERLRAALADTTFSDPRVPVYTNVDAQPLSQADAIAETLERQLTSPVRWQDSVLRMHADGIQTMWELGPGKTLCGMIQRTAKDVQTGNLDKPEDLLQLVEDDQASESGGFVA